MNIQVKFSCGCELEWHDLDVPPALNAPCYCPAHGDVSIIDVSVAGVADFFVHDADGNWWHRGRIVTDDELASKLANTEHETFPCFTKSVPPALIIIN
jgi:hypothetical protein